MMQSQLQAQQSAPLKPMKTPIATLCAQAQLPERPMRPTLAPSAVLQNLTNQKSSVRPYLGAFEKASGLKANPFEICGHPEGALEGDSGLGVSSVASMAYPASQALQMPADEQVLQVERVGATNVVAYAERGILVDQQRPILLLKRQQITPRGAQTYDQGSIGNVTDASAPHQAFSQGVWPPNPGFISQAGDSSSGYVSSDQERTSFLPQGQTRGMHSDDLLHYSYS